MIAREEEQTGVYLCTRRQQVVVVNALEVLGHCIRPFDESVPTCVTRVALLIDEFIPGEGSNSAR